MWWEGEICQSPFVDNQTNITWTLLLPPFPCPPLPGHGTSPPWKFIQGEHSLLFFSTPDLSAIPPGAPQHAQATCLLWKFCKCIAIQLYGPFTDFNFFLSHLFSILWPLSLQVVSFPHLFLFLLTDLFAPCIYHSLVLSTASLYGWVVYFSVYPWPYMGEWSIYLSTGSLVV